MYKTIAASALLAAASAADSAVFGAYFANWAQYHADPYGYTADDLAAIVPKTDIMYYAFSYFCPSADLEPAYWVDGDLDLCDGVSDWGLVSPEPTDEDMYATVVGYKEQNPDMKVILSVGGWNFPSSYFSKMVSTEENRAAFIASTQDYMDKYGFDGIDIDWEYPGSEPRVDPVKISCDFFQNVTDSGGDADNDGDNLLSLVQEMRTAYGDDKMITVCGQAGKPHWEIFPMKEMSDYIDYWNVMSYDYSVSDIEMSNVTAPNMPLYTPTGIEGVPEWGMNYTVTGWLEAGVPAEKMMLGMAYYGHTWYTPSVEGDDWQAFGVPAEVQGECCGPFGTTYGAKYGKGCSLCGSMMYSEIVAAGFDVYFDEATQSHIGFLAADSEDAWTEANTWVSFNDKESLSAIAQYALDMGLAGAFAFDTSMDTTDYSGLYTYELSNLIADAMHGSTGGNECNPDAGCNVCDECCASYIPDGDSCDSCVEAQC